MKFVPVLAAALMSCAWAQDIKMPPSFEKLAAKAKETVDVTLDGSTLALAGNALSATKTNEATAKQMLNGLKGVYVRSFEFEKEGEYSQADIDAVRSQLQPPQWSRIVNVRSQRESAEVYIKPATEGQVGGLVVIAAEPKELTVVNLVGNIRPEDLSKLGGQFGIPNVEMGNRSTPPRKAEPAPAAKEKEE